MEKLRVDDNGSQESTSSIRGKIKAIHVVYDATSNAATDITIKTKSNVTEGADQTVLTLTNNNTSGWYYPRTPAQDNTGNDVTFDGSNEIYTEFVSFGNMELTQAQNTAEKGTTAYILLEEFQKMKFQNKTGESMKIRLVSENPLGYSWKTLKQKEQIELEKQYGLRLGLTIVEEDENQKQIKNNDEKILIQINQNQMQTKKKYQKKQIIRKNYCQLKESEENQSRI